MGLVACETMIVQAVCHLDKGMIHHQGCLEWAQLAVYERGLSLTTGLYTTQRGPTFAHQ